MIYIRGHEEVQILGLNSKYEIVSSSNWKVTEDSMLLDLTLDEIGDLWVSIFDCSIVKVF